MKDEANKKKTSRFMQKANRCDNKYACSYKLKAFPSMPTALLNCPLLRLSQRIWLENASDQQRALFFGHENRRERACACWLVKQNIFVVHPQNMRQKRLHFVCFNESQKRTFKCYPVWKSCYFQSPHILCFKSLNSCAYGAILF